MYNYNRRRSFWLPCFTTARSKMGRLSWASVRVPGPFSELRRGGLWACPQLSSYSWWGCEYNMYRLLTKLYLQLFWEKLMHELYYWSASVSVGHPAGALAITCRWVILTWLIYTYGMLCQDDVAPGEYLLLQCACQYLLDWAHQLMYVHNQFLIVVSSSGMLAMLGMGAGPSKLW